MLWFYDFHQNLNLNSYKKRTMVLNVFVAPKSTLWILYKMFKQFYWAITFLFTFYSYHHIAKRALKDWRSCHENDSSRICYLGRASRRRGGWGCSFYYYSTISRSANGTPVTECRTVRQWAPHTHTNSLPAWPFLHVNSLIYYINICYTDWMYRFSFLNIKKIEHSIYLNLLIF